MNKLLIVWCMCMAVMAAQAQSDESVWNSEMKVEDNKYVLNLPDQWKKVPLTDGAAYEYKLDFTGVGIPGSVGTSPLYANFTISHLAGNKRMQAMDEVMTDFSGFYDRITEPGYNYDTTTVTTKTGETGTLLHSRYYRRSKVSNYSKYYLIVYSPKSDQTYILTLNFQYKDPSYDIERSAHLAEYAKKVFEHFELR